MDVTDTELVACDFEIIIFQKSNFVFSINTQVSRCLFVTALKCGLMIILCMW